MGLLPIPKIQRPAPVSQPAHDDFVPAYDLEAVNAQILPSLEWTTGDNQSPSDERPGIARPTGLHRIATKIDIDALQDSLLASRIFEFPRVHV